MRWENASPPLPKNEDDCDSEKHKTTFIAESKKHKYKIPDLSRITPLTAKLEELDKSTFKSRKEHIAKMRRDDFVRMGIKLSKLLGRDHAEDRDLHVKLLEEKMAHHVKVKGKIDSIAAL